VHFVYKKIVAIFNLVVRASNMCPIMDALNHTAALE
jgi:hypothetical protein